MAILYCIDKFLKHTCQNSPCSLEVYGIMKAWPTSKFLKSGTCSPIIRDSEGVATPAVTS